MQDLPSKTITVSIEGNSYEIKFPNNGQLIDIETAKLNLTSGNQNKMLFGTIQSQRAYLLVEAICTFSVLIPELKKDLKAVGSLMELDPIQSKSIVKAYTDVFYPWYQNWFSIINDDVKKEDDSK